MACPYFMPLAKLENGNWPHPARLPLGSGWTGHCTVPGHNGQTPPHEIIQAFCNLGYACRCPWAPDQRAWDAVRFSISAFEQPAGAARVVRLLYVCERDHHPMAHGELLFELPSGHWLRGHDDARIQKMAECFLDSYLSKKAPKVPNCSSEHFAP